MGSALPDDIGEVGRGLTELNESVPNIILIHYQYIFSSALLPLATLVHVNGFAKLSSRLPCSDRVQLLSKHLLRRGLTDLVAHNVSLSCLSFTIYHATPLCVPTGGSAELRS